MSLNILVINPYVCDFKLYDEWMHPAGLYFLIDALIENGHNVSYFNCLQRNNNSRSKYGTGHFDYIEIEKPQLYSELKRKYKLYGRPVSDLIRFLDENPEPDFICIGSMMTYWAGGVLETIRIIRTILKETSIIIGGIAAQLIPDFFKKNVPNCRIGSLKDHEIRNLLEIHELTPPSFLHSLKLLKETINHGPLILSVGCPMKCSYCASSILQPHFQIRNPDTVLKEIEYMIDHFGVRDFAFYDDALLYKPEEMLIPMLKQVLQRNYNIRFHTPNGLHLRFIDEGLLEDMINCGFTTFRFGYETSDKRYLKDISGKIVRDELVNKLQTINKICSKNQDTGIYVMGGLKEQTPEQMLEEMDFVGSLRVKVKPVFISPVPGTALYQHYLSSFPLIQLDPLWHNDSFFITQLPGWNSEAVERVRKKAKSINSKLVNQ